MKEFLLVMLQNYSVQAATLLLRYFLQYVPKTSFLKNILSKNSMVDQLHDKVATIQYTTVSFMKKTEPMEDLPTEALRVLFTSKCLWWGVLFTKYTSAEFIPAIS